MRMPILVFLLAGLLLALPGSAQDESGAEAPADPPAETPADDEAGAGGADSEDEGADEEDFEFSEEVPADEQLVFPVDI